jgi:hypothetical protein
LHRRDFESHRTLGDKPRRLLLQRWRARSVAMRGMMLSVMVAFLLIQGAWSG